MHMFIQINFVLPKRKYIMMVSTSKSYRTFWRRVPLENTPNVTCSKSVLFSRRLRSLFLPRQFQHPNPGEHIIIEHRLLWRSFVTRFRPQFLNASIHFVIFLCGYLTFQVFHLRQSHNFVHGRLCYSYTSCKPATWSWWHGFLRARRGVNTWPGRNVVCTDFWIRRLYGMFFALYLQQNTLKRLGTSRQFW